MVNSNPFSFILLHNLILIDAGYKCDTGFYENSLPGTVYEAMYKSGLCIDMRF